MVPARPWVAKLCLGVLCVALGCKDDLGDRQGVIGGTGGRSGPDGGGPVDAGPPPPPIDAVLPDLGALDGAQFNCPATPVAWVLDTTDPFTMQPSQAAALLGAAGFEVRPLPLDQDPSKLRGLIVLASFASESPMYKEYVRVNATRLYSFVDGGNVLLQLTQADQTEPAPPFLPGQQTAIRNDADAGRLYARNPQHPLLADVPLKPDGSLDWEWAQLGWELFAAQGGFEVVLAAGANADQPALMEGAYGQGRFVLAAMALDKPVGLGPQRDRFNTAFFRNLHRHVMRICERQPTPINVTPSSTQPGFQPGSTMLAVLPDTQIYSLRYPGVYTAQTSWIAANARRLNIAYVLHLGDIVDLNTPVEWGRAAQAMAQLHGIVPYALAPGNHDYGPAGGARTRDTLLNDYFPYAREAAMPTFGGAFEEGKLDNTYHYLTVGGRDYILFALEWGPRDATVAWADEIMARNQDRYGILITHAYLNWNDKRYDINGPPPQDFNPHFYGTAGGVNDGEQLWNKLVKKHRFVMVFNGHVLNDGTGYLASVTDHGNLCHQMLSNYQMRPVLGGEGYLRLIEFLTDGRTVRVFTYTPLYDSFLTEPDQTYSFTLDLPPGPRPTP